MYDFGNKNEFNKKYTIEKKLKGSTIFELDLNNNKSKRSIMKKKIIAKNAYDLNELNELFIYSRLGTKCNSIVQLKKIYCWENEKCKGTDICLVLEKCDLSLKGTIEEDKYMNDKALIKLAVQLIAGYIHMLERGVYHKDIKPDNILIKNGNYKIVDFDISEVNDKVIIINY